MTTGAGLPAATTEPAPVVAPIPAAVPAAVPEDAVTMTEPAPFPAAPVVPYVEAPASDADLDRALAGRMLEHGEDPGALLAPRERPGVVKRARRLLGLDEAPPPVAPAGPLEDELRGLTAAQRLARVVELAEDGDERVTVAVLSEARAAYDLDRMRQPANARRAAADKVARLEAAAADVLAVLADDDPDLVAARQAWQETLEAARRALVHAEVWQERTRPVVGRFDALRGLAITSGADPASDLVDAAAARAIVVGTLGASAPVLGAALAAVLTGETPPGSSLWARMPVNVPAPFTRHPAA